MQAFVASRVTIVGAYSAGLFHLITHAYFKALLFLCAGAIIHSLSNQQDMRFMGGMRKKLPVVAITYFVGMLAISGILFSGFFSKEAIFSGLLESHNFILLSISVLVAGMTAFYMFRAYFMVFEGEYRGTAHLHKPNSIIILPLIVLAIPSAFLGFMIKDSFPSFITHIELFQYSHSDIIVFIHNMLPFISVFVVFFGVFLASVFYWDKFKISANLEVFAKKLKPVYELCINKWYFDDVYEFFVSKIFLRLSKFTYYFDKIIIDGFVNMIGFVAILKSKVISFLQNAKLQTYIAYSLSGFSLISILILAIWVYINF